MPTEIEELRAQLTSLAQRVDTMDDANAIRRLHFAYGYFIDNCLYDEVVDLFSADGEALFLSGVYRGHASIARLYKTWFQTLFTQGRPGPVDGFLLDHFQMQDIITVSEDRTTAKARFRALLAGGSHESRAYQPEGLPAQFWEAGLYENGYVREDGVWKIRRLDYVVQWQADYEKGWAYQEAHLRPSTICYPENPLGPDELLDMGRPAWPARAPMPFHYVHPVTGLAIG